MIVVDVVVARLVSFLYERIMVSNIRAFHIAFNVVALVPD